MLSLVDSATVLDTCQRASDKQLFFFHHYYSIVITFTTYAMVCGHYLR